MLASKQTRSALVALLVVLPGGLWILALAALVNAIRRHHARYGAAAEGPASTAPASADGHFCAVPPASEATSSCF